MNKRTIIDFHYDVSGLQFPTPPKAARLLPPTPPPGVGWAPQIRSQPQPLNGSPTRPRRVRGTAIPPPNLSGRSRREHERTVRRLDSLKYYPRRENQSPPRRPSKSSLLSHPSHSKFKATGRRRLHCTACPIRVTTTVHQVRQRGRRKGSFPRLP